MNKLFTLLLVSLFTSLTINAQNSKNDYEKAVDYCACKIAYAYTEDFASKNPSLDEKKSFDEVISKKLNNCEKKNISISELEKLLKENNFNGFSKTLIPDAEKATTSYSDNFNKDDAINSILTSFKLSFDKIDIKSELSNSLNNKLQSFGKQEETKINPNLVNETDLSVSANNGENSSQIETTFFPNWLLFVLILLFFIILLFYNYSNNKKLNERIGRRLRTSEYEQNKIKFTPSNNRNKSNNSRSERDIKDIYDKISELNLAIERLQNSNSTSSVSSVHKTNQVKNISQPKPKENQKFVFAKTPIEDKVFNAFDVTDVKDGKFYKFLLKENNQAEFEFFNTENSAKRALNAPDSFLYPACEETEPLNQNANKIITIKPGIAIKQENKWIVKEKAQITYE
jgi:hypothetical protein